MANKTINDFSLTSEVLLSTRFLSQRSDDITESMSVEQLKDFLLNEEVFLIKSEADFPAPVGGVISLDTGTYIISGTVNMTNKLCVSDGQSVMIKGNNFDFDKLVYSGAGAFINCGNNFSALSVNQLTVSTPAGTVHDITPASPVASQIFIQNVQYDNCLSLGTISNVAVLIIDFSGAFDFGDGITINDISVGCSIQSVQFRFSKNTGGTFITFGGTAVNVFNVTGCYFQPNTNDDVLYIDPATSITQGLIAISQYDKTLGGDFFQSGSQDQNNTELKFIGNSFVSDTNPDMFMTAMGSNITTIAVASSPVRINATWTEVSSQLFDFDASGRATYKGKENISLPITFNARFLAAGTNQTVYAYIYKNGVQQTNLKSGARCSSTDSASITLPGQISLETDDYVEVYVENSSGANNITTNLAKLVIN